MEDNVRNEIVIDPAPDDWHIHLRFGEILREVTYWSARWFRRMLAMGNVPAVETVEQALDHDQETNHESRKQGSQVIVAPKLTTTTPLDEIDAFADAGFDILKLYLGITTGSDNGIVGLKRLYSHFEVMQSRHMVLPVHMESADLTIDYDLREVVCLPELAQAVKDFPRLRFVIEHISCEQTADFLREMWAKGIRNVAGTVALQHFKHNKNDVSGGEADPHLMCKPPIQGFASQRSIQRLVLVDKLPNVFQGGDSAPHKIEFKGPEKIRNGVFNGPVLFPEWLRIFLADSDLPSLINFTSVFGAEYYQRPRNKEKLIVVRQPWIVPDLIGGCRPYMAGKIIEYDAEGFV